MTERLELIAQYADGHRVIVDALSEVQLDERPAAGEWTPREIVHHVADAEITRSVRLRRLLSEDCRHIAGFDQDAYARTLHYERPVDTALQTIRASIESNLDLIERLTEEEWSRDGTHDEFGRFGVGTWLLRAAAHAREHAEQIRRCRR